MQILKFKRIVRNEYVYSIITKFITFAIGIIQSVLVARYLGAELKGVNAYVSSIVSIGGIVITFGMHQAYPYFRKKLGKDAIYTDYLSLTVLLFSIYFIIGLILAVIFRSTPELSAVFILIPIFGYSRVVGYVALVEHPNKRNSWWTIISVLDIIYVALLWIFIKRNVFWGISILAFAEVLKCISFTCILKIHVKIHKGLFPILKELGKFGFFPMVALLMTTLNYRIDVLMLHHYSYITDSMIGVYSLGLSLSDKIVMIPDTLKGVLVSKLSKGAHDDEVAKVSRIGFWASLLLALVIFAFGRIAINILYGEEYYDAYPIVLITAAGVLAVSYFKLIAQYNIVNKKQKLNVLMLSIAIIVDVVFNLLFIPVWGIQGAALATCLGNVVCGVVFIIYFCRKTGTKASEMILLQRSDMEALKALLKKKKR